MEQENIVRYWHAVELLQPQSAPKLKPRSNPYSAFFHDTPIECPIPPWATESIVHQQILPKTRVWSHTLYAHLYDSRLVAQRLKQICGADQGYREQQYRESALFAVKFNMDGRLIADSFVLSSEAWFLGQVLKGSDWTRGFEEDQTVAVNHANTLLADQVTGDTLRMLTHWVLQFLGIVDFFDHMDRYSFRFRSQPVNPDKSESEDDPLNSFLLSDLADIADSISQGVTSKPLDQYLCQHDHLERLHLDDDRASIPVIEHLMPEAYPLGCWPSERHLGLVHSQQLAVNTIHSTLANSRGLLGINGPPGTGKTTLLRDLIASIISSRADVLANLRRASDGFIHNGRETANDGGKQQTGFKLKPVLYGFEIVVASSNNGAVENITLELPQRDKIDESWLPESAYFAEIGELVTGKPAWGLMSSALGSKARRKQFVDRYFYGQVSQDSDNKADSEIEEDVATDPDEKKQLQGFWDWLNANAQMNADRSSEQRQAVWQQAVSEYNAVKDAARQASVDAGCIRSLIQTIHQTRTRIADTIETLSTLKQKLTEAVTQLTHLDTNESRPANMALKRCLEAIKQHQVGRPGFWVNLLSLWRTQRDWNATQALLESERDLASADFTRITRLTEQLDASRKRLDIQINDIHRELLGLQGHAEAATKDAARLATVYKADHLLAWLQGNTIGRGDAIELAEPWHIEGWRQARARVFIQALKLHRTFFELEASRMRSNLCLINGLLTGPPFQGLSHDTIRSAWACLFMLVPVLSSTFASFARSFGTFGVGEIGWVLVDEAGQASPQAAVGALWRSRRAVLVGDPLQLKPILTVSDAVLEYIRTRYRVDAHWLPNRQSAQTLADQATRWGRMAGPATNKTWVGLPLVVHRRCDKPMHDVANRIAYDGAMVYGTDTPSPGKETSASLPTGWIQVSGTSDGNWVPAEGKALRALLALLRTDGVKPEEISVITPFTDVRNDLKRLVGNNMVFGTIHTMQGKEAPIVIIVLGGNTTGPGARSWAVSEPNLLNVAATRAKRRLYVIGDRRDWEKRPLFCEVMDLLPLIELPPSTEGEQLSI